MGKFGVQVPPELFDKLSDRVFDIGYKAVARGLYHSKENYTLLRKDRRMRRA
jgi:hypothetical protein